MQQEFRADQRSASFARGMHRGIGLAVASFFPVAATAIPAHAVTEVYHRVNGPHGAAYTIVKGSSTSSRPKQSIIGKAMGADDTHQARSEASVLDIWQYVAVQAWADEASARIQYLRGKPDGWRGEGSVAPGQEAVDDALAFVEKLQMETPKAVPMISLDEDGEFIFFWKQEDLLASIVVAGDGRYTFFGKRGGPDVIREALALADPFPPEVTAILAPREALGDHA